MQVTEFPSLAEHVRTLPAEGAGRERQLQHLVDVYASAEAAAALQAASTRLRDNFGVLPRVLAAADAVLGGSLADRGLLMVDVAALDRLREAVGSLEFLTLVPDWIRELRETALAHPDSGACTIATALEVWLWAMKDFKMNHGSASGAIDELAEALCPLIAARCLVLDVTAQDGRGSSAALRTSGVSPAQDDTMAFRSDLCAANAAQASARLGAACAELVFGYRRHLVWDAEGCGACYAGDDIDDLEALIPGIASGSRMAGDVVESDGSHAAKRGPCARFDGVERFMQLRSRLDGCLTGARIAKDRAAAAIARAGADTTSKGKA